MSGKIPTTQFLDLLNSLKDEKEYVIWADIAFSLGKLKSVWFEEDETTIKKLENLICSLFSPLATSLGWEYSKGESENDSLLRTLAIPLSINNGNKVLLQEARVRFIEFLSGNEEAIPTDLRGPIFGAIIKFGSSNDYDSVGKIYRETKVADQKTQALAALSYTQDTKLILRTLEFSLSKEVRSQDIIYVYRNISSNFKARRMAWSFLQEYYSTFHDEGSTTLLMSIIAALLGNLTTLKDIADIRLFFKDKETSSISTRIDQSVERIGIHANWLEREKLNVSNWLHSRIP